MLFRSFGRRRHGDSRQRHGDGSHRRGARRHGSHRHPAWPRRSPWRRCGLGRRHGRLRLGQRPRSMGLADPALCRLCDLLLFGGVPAPQCRPHIDRPRAHAPVAGAYNFSFVVLGQGLSNGDVCEFGIFVSGVGVVLGGRMTYQANYTGTSGYMWSSGSGTFSLAAGDYVEIRNQSGGNRTVNNSAWVNFSGFLIG